MTDRQATDRLPQDKRSYLLGIVLAVIIVIAILFWVQAAYHPFYHPVLSSTGTLTGNPYVDNPKAGFNIPSDTPTGQNSAIPDGGNGPVEPAFSGNNPNPIMGTGNEPASGNGAATGQR